MGRVVIMQPYLPAYRISLFAGVVERLGERGHSCVVVTGRAPGREANRGDSVSISPPWHKTRWAGTVSFRGHRLSLNTGFRHWRRHDVLVVQLAAGAVETYMGLALRHLYRIVTWGHVGIYTGSPNRAIRALETWQLRRADAVFAYTQRGAADAEARRRSSAGVVALGNTVETSGLIRNHTGTSEEPPISCRELLAVPTGLNKRRTLRFAFIGGLDKSKRIDFLVQALDLLWSWDRNIHLLVGGHGDQESLLRPAAKRGQVSLLGRVDNEGKRFMAETCVALLNPGRVGLVAVDSFALALPIVTTDWPYHAPEFEYLEPDYDSLVTGNSVDEYARAVYQLAHDGTLQKRLQASARLKAGWPPLSVMIDKFVAECLHLLESDPARRPRDRQVE